MLLAWSFGREEGWWDVPWEPQWYWEISSGRETETRSLMPTTRRTAERKARGGDLDSKERDSGFEVSETCHVLSLQRTTHHAHSFTDNKHQSLICQSCWRCEEEVRERNMEQGQRGNDRVSRYERHLGGCVLFGREREELGEEKVRGYYYLYVFS